MIRIFVLACLLATPAMAEKNKVESCGYQGDVMAAVQKARLARVKEGNVEQAILADNPSWPTQYNAAIAGLTKHVYQLKRRDLRKVDLGTQLRTQCIDNWDRIQEMQRGLKN